MQRYRAVAMLLTAIVSSPTTRSAYARARPKNMCLMQYLVADNDLEYAITADLLELIDSEFIRQPNVQTWVYYDAHGDMDDYDGDGFNDAPLSDDAAPTILWFDHVSEQLGVVQKFVESNSDTIAVLSYFLARALTDCIKNGAEEFVLTFSSHGGGHIGFGGDMNIGAGRRRLYQSNQNIASGMQYALQQVDGAPSKFDLVGFDACLMSSFLAVREYAPLTTHILASEATVPGHGWYWNIPSSAANSAFSMGIELHSLYLSETQAPYSYTESQNSTIVETHKTPKTLALIDTVGFDAFLVAFERFARELTKVIKASNDQNFFASIQRTRNGIMAFEASDDQPGTSHPSAVDIGSFLVVFREKCSPIPLTAISTALEDAIATYDALFVVRGVGPGTKPATGMSVYFPSKKGWNQDAYHSVNYGDTSNDWVQFLLVYLTSSTPTEMDGYSICRTSFKSDIQPTFEGQLLLNPSLVPEDKVMVSSDITANTDFVKTIYGFTDSGIEGSARRRIMEVAKAYLDSFQSPRYYTSQMRPQRKRTRQHKAREQKPLIMFSGALAPVYDGPTYSCVWNRVIYLAYGRLDGGDFFVYNTALYVTALGDGVMNIPALYYPPYQDINDDILPYGSPVADALALGAYLATVHFTVDEVTGEVVSPISLYKSALPGERGSMYEVPRSDGGFVVPIINAEASHGDDALLLELNGDIHKWGADFGILPLDAATYSNKVSLDSIVFDVSAWDLDLDATDLGGLETHRFTLALHDRTAKPTRKPTLPRTKRPRTKPTRKPSRSPSLGPTPKPTRKPSRSPSLGPTPKPSRKPSRSPSLGPTPKPTRKPSRSPSLGPTPKPTRKPSRSPSMGPTPKPTRKPSHSPSLGPTPKPTRKPSRSPSLGPTPKPTRKPSRSPSLGPTLPQTDKPTTKPTRTPSHTLSLGSTLPHTDRPTTKPTRKPSYALSLSLPLSPKDTPTTQIDKPTTDPTEYPTYMPTKESTRPPSPSPTDTPTKKPTKAPSLSPTGPTSDIRTDASSLAHSPTDTPTTLLATPPDVSFSSLMQPAADTPTSVPVTDATQIINRAWTNLPSIRSGPPSLSPMQSPTDAPMKEPMRDNTKTPPLSSTTSPSGAANGIPSLTTFSQTDMPSNEQFSEFPFPSGVPTEERLSGSPSPSNVPSEKSDYNSWPPSPSPQTLPPSPIPPESLLVANFNKANSSGRCSISFLAVFAIHLSGWF